MVEAGTLSFPAKIHPEKKPQSKKTRRCPIENLITYRTPSSFSASGFFLYVKFCRQTAASEFGQGHSTVENLLLNQGKIQYCTYDRQEITAWLARGAFARVSVNFRKFSPCIARARRARAGLTVYPPSRTLELLAFDE